ncbi:hypothetical protein IGI04_038676 [Brassica rapa subsp. trilocularis]|uniref:Protein SDA1 n=1 Tax=Brassica rapa subsp. trilocularis TaxID=1813537 RepID=A0ABQ7LN78_BRACM|nr:hypothetical protein IGI04_038676 [Brassica rapa subsp. trilocularis]
MSGSLGRTPESLKASGRSSEKLSLPILQGKIKRDPDGYETELQLIYKQFKASVDLFQQQAALSFSSVGSDPSVAKDLGDRAMFLAHVTPFYPKQLAEFPSQLTDLLRTSCLAMPSGLRNHVSQALILLMNRKSLVIEDLLALFLDVQCIGDRNLRKLAFSHIVQTIRKMSVTDPRHKGLQKIVISMLEQEDETKAKRALVTLCELLKKKVWLGDRHERVAIAICEACFHASPRIMVSSLRFLLDYENIEDEDDSDASDNDDDEDAKPENHVVINREAVYKANNKGTSSSKKKKQAKLQRAMKSIKKKQRASSESTTSTYSPLNHLNDPQKFAEKLLSRLQTGKSIGKTSERIETRLMMMKVIARTIGLHKLQLLSFYTYLQNYAKPHEKDVTQILAAAVQACHDGVPSDAVKPLFMQIVNQFVHDRSRPEAIAVGLNVIREMCLRIPELMTEELLQDLALYKKEHEKAISAGARSLIALFREINPSLLVKKDRGRPGGPVAKPKQFGEVNVFSDVPNVELLQESDHESGSDEDDDDAELPGKDSGSKEKAKGKKRKMVDFDANLLSADTSLRALKRFAEAKSEQPCLDENDGILSNEDFRKIKDLQAKKEAKLALARKGFKVPDSDQLSKKRVNPAKLEAHIRHKLTKEQRMELVKAGREDRVKYQSRTATKQKKVGGSSNKQKEHKKNMPLAAIRSKAGRSKRSKKMKKSNSGTQFRGRKAWK